MKITFSVVLVGALVLLIQNHQAEAVVGLGACPTVTPPAVANDPFLAAGVTMFEQRRFPARSEFLLRCVQYVFGAQANAPITHSLTITGVRGRTRRTVSVSGTITQSAVDAVAGTFQRWAASFPARVPFFSPYPTQYTVIAVDSANLAAPTWVALYSCKAIGPINIRSLSILTTLQAPAAATISTAVAAVASQGLPTNKLITVSQTNC